MVVVPLIPVSLAHTVHMPAGPGSYTPVAISIIPPFVSHIKAVRATGLPYWSVPGAVNSCTSSAVIVGFAGSIVMVFKTSAFTVMAILLEIPVSLAHMVYVPDSVVVKLPQGGIVRGVG